VKLHWTEACGEAIGANWLRAALAPSGALGRRARERERAFARGDEAAARARIAQVDRIGRSVEGARLARLRATLAAAPDVGAALVRARAGGVLGDVEFFELVCFLDALEAVAASADAEAFGDALPRADAPLSAKFAAGRTRSGSFYLDDAFDPELGVARAEAMARQAAYDAARSRLTERIARFAGVEAIRDGEFVLMRERATGPLPAEIHVLRETQTYLLCELSLDEPALAAQAARDAATARVAEIEEGVRARLSAEVGSSAPALERARDSLGEVELLVSRAQFAQQYACAVPEIVEAPEAAFADARYLPLALALERHGRRYAPISLELEGIGVVTGPNMGGKTAALRTLGFLAACVALGVPVPASSARLPLVDEIAWLGIGAAPEDDSLLSSFGAEVVALRSFLGRELALPLVLIDEFARTTSPREGRALLVALLETLRERGALALAATHLAHVTPNGRVAHFAIGGLDELPPRDGAPLDLEAALRRIAESMDYRLRRVAEDAQPPSDAIALADALGLDASLIARAKEHM
jgi:DNA mismatch repair protein MutS2